MQGACIWYDNSGMKKENYRRYNLNNIKRSDDYAALRYVLNSRLVKLQESNNLPDLILIDANSKKYFIGNPKKEKPITLKLLDKKLHYKLLLHPDLYLGEAYTDGTLIIENGSLTEFLEIAMGNLGRNEINISGQITR